MVIKLACYWNIVTEWRLWLLAALNEWRGSKYASLVMELSYLLEVESYSKYSLRFHHNPYFFLIPYVLDLIPFLYVGFRYSGCKSNHAGPWRVYSGESAFSGSNEPEKEWILLPSLYYAPHISSTMPSSRFFPYHIYCRLFPLSFQCNYRVLLYKLWEPQYTLWFRKL